MAEHSVPVDLFNPGQVFACLGLLEAADVLLGDAEGGFDWSDAADTRFHLRAAGDDNPVAAVLRFLAEAEVRRFGPTGYSDPPPKKKNNTGDDPTMDDEEDGFDSNTKTSSIELTEIYPAAKGDQMALPIRFGGGNRPIIELGHWMDGSSRENFKLYSGNRSADKIARAMAGGSRDKPTKRQKQNSEPGELKTKGIAQLWDDGPEDLVERPFHVLTPMGGSFNFDPRGAWTAIDAGYSPNDHKHPVTSSPVVEFLAAWGLEHARPNQVGRLGVTYAVWQASLPPELARAALPGRLPVFPVRRFHFELELSGKNKVVTFAQEESIR